MKDYYQILELDNNASATEIKKSYKRLALKYHPDKNLNDKNATKNFIKISEAYQVLSDPTQKELYDKNNCVSITFEDAFELFNNVFNSLDPIIGDYLKTTFSQITDNLLDESTTASDILKTFTNDKFIDKTTNTLNKYIKKRTLSSKKNYFEHAIKEEIIKNEKEYAIDIDIDFLCKYSGIKLVISNDKIKNTFFLELIYNEFTINFNESVYKIEIYNNFPENLYRKSNYFDLELILDVHIDDYLSGFNYYNKITPEFILDLDIKPDKTNIIKVLGRGLYNLDEKEKGDLYIILKPNKTSNLMNKIKNYDNLNKSYKNIYI